jgi:hypothetical protein
LFPIFAISSHAAGEAGAGCLKWAHRQGITASNPHKEKQMELIFAIALPVAMIFAINALLQGASQVRFAA